MPQGWNCSLPLRAGVRRKGSVIILTTHTHGSASRQYGNVGQFAIEIYLPVRATNKDENRRRLCFWKLASLNPIRHILVDVKTEPFFSVREHLNYDSLTLTRSIVRQDCELKSLSNFYDRLHRLPPARVLKNYYSLILLRHPSFCPHSSHGRVTSLSRRLPVSYNLTKQDLAVWPNDASRLPEIRRWGKLRGP